MAEVNVRQVKEDPLDFKFAVNQISKLDINLMLHQQVSSALRSNKGSTNRESTSSRRHGSTRSSNLTSLITNFGSIVDKVEVYNSVEVRVASSSAPSPTHPEDLIKSTRGFSPRSAASKFRKCCLLESNFIFTNVFNNCSR